MRKITQFLLALTMFMGGVNCAWAWDADAVYTLKAGGSSAYATTMPGNETYEIAVPVASAPEYFRITGSETDGWKLQSVSTNKYVGLSGAWNAGNTEQTWDIVAVDGEANTYYVRRHGGNNALGWDNVNDIPKYIYTNKGATAFKWVIQEKVAYINVGAAATSLTAGNWYILHNVGRNGYVSQETDALKMRAPQNCTDGALLDNSKKGYVFQLVAVDGGYNLKSGNGKYFSLGRDVSYVSEQAVKLEIDEISAGTGKFYIKDTESGYIADGKAVGYTFVGWATTPPTSTTGNSAYEFLPVELYSWEVTDYVQNAATIKTNNDVRPSDRNVTLDGNYYVVKSVAASVANEIRKNTVEIAPLSEVLPTGYYTMGSVASSRVQFMYSDILTKPATIQSTASTRPGNNAIWHITSSTTSNKITVCNQQGTTLTMANGTTSFAELTPEKYYSENGAFYFTEAINASAGGNGYSPTVWKGYPNEADNHWIFTPVTLDADEIYNVTITGLADAYVTYNGDVAKDGGFLVSSASIAASDITPREYLGYQAAVTVDGQNINVVYSEDASSLPLNFSTVGADGVLSEPYYYTMTCGGKYAYYDADQAQQLRLAATLPTDNVARNYFYFVGDNVDGFTINSAVLSTNKAFDMTLGTEKFNEHGTLFTLSKKGETYVLTVKGTANIANNSSGQNYVGVWNNGNTEAAAAQFTFAPAETDVVKPAVADYLIAQANARADAGDFTTEIGYYSEENVTIINTAVAEVEADKGNLAKHEALRAATTNLVISQPVAGRFYAIRDYRYDQYVDGAAFPSSKVSHTAKAVDGLSATQIWYLDESMKGYCYGTGFGLNKGVEKAGVDNAGVFTFEVKNTASLPATFAVRVPNGGQNAYWWVWDDNNGNYGHVDRNGNNYVETNCQFYIEEVTSLPVTINAVKYATLYSPVALTVPSGVTAYVAAQEGDLIKLTSTSVVPANVGVILYADIDVATTYDFAIGGTSTEASALTGTVATKVSETGDYVLSKGTIGGKAGQIGMFPVRTDEQLKGFKAYLHTTSATRAFSFSFDELETAITAAHSDLREGETYNIAGQRVQRATKGLYIINGKKVLVK